MFAPGVRVARTITVVAHVLATFVCGEVLSARMRARRAGAGVRVARRIHYSAVELVVHVMLAVSGYHLVAQNDDVRAALAPARLWQSSPLPPPVVYFYATQAAAYASFLLLALLDAATPDRRSMIAHHLVALFLIAYSAAHGMWPAGLAIMLACDPSDVALHAAKLAKDAFESELGATLAFCVFSVLWAWQRLRGIVGLVAAPYVASYACTLLPRACPAGARVAGTTGIGALALALLAVLFLVWTRDIVRAAWRKMRYGELEDVRELDADPDVQPQPHAK